MIVALALVAIPASLLAVGTTWPVIGPFSLLLAPVAASLAALGFAIVAGRAGEADERLATQDATAEMVARLSSALDEAGAGRRRLPPGRTDAAA